LKLIFNIAWITSLLTFIAHNIYFQNLDLSTLSSNQWRLKLLLKNVHYVGMLIAASLAIVLSFMHYPDSKNKLKAKLLIFASILFSLANTFLIFYSFILLTNFPINKDNLLNNPHYISTYKSVLYTKKQTLSARIRISNLFASNTYIQKGIITNVVDKNGSIVAYKPTSKDSKLKKEYEQTVATFTHTMNNMKYSALSWLIVMLGSIGVGIIILRRKLSKK